MGTCTKKEQRGGSVCYTREGGQRNSHSWVSSCLLEMRERKESLLTDRAVLAPAGHMCDKWDNSVSGGSGCLLPRFGEPRGVCEQRSEHSPEEVWS